MTDTRLGFPPCDTVPTRLGVVRAAVVLTQRSTVVRPGPVGGTDDPSTDRPDITSPPDTPVPGGLVVGPVGPLPR